MLIVILLLAAWWLYLAWKHRRKLGFGQCLVAGIVIEVLNLAFGLSPLEFAIAIGTAVVVILLGRAANPAAGPRHKRA